MIIGIVVFFVTKAKTDSLFKIINWFFVIICLIMSVVLLDILVCILRTFLAVKVTSLGLKDIFSYVLMTGLVVGVIASISLNVIFASSNAFFVTLEIASI